MNLNDRLKDYHSKTRKIGRYHVSSLYNMLTPSSNFYMPPEDYFKVNLPEFDAMMRMLKGSADHHLIQQLFQDCPQEVKKEMEFGNFVLVGMFDILHKDRIIELKTNRTKLINSGPWYEWQARAYCSMFEKDFCDIMQPTEKKGSLNLRLVKTIKRNDKWFAGTMEKLEEYHLALEKLTKMC